MLYIKINFFKKLILIIFFLTFIFILTIFFLELNKLIYSLSSMLPYPEINNGKPFFDYLNIEDFDYNSPYFTKEKQAIIKL